MKTVESSRLSSFFVLVSVSWQSQSSGPSTKVVWENEERKGGGESRVGHRHWKQITILIGAALLAFWSSLLDMALMDASQFSMAVGT